MSRDDLHEPPSRAEGEAGDEARLGRPRVVIFELESGPTVEILEDWILEIPE